MMELPTVSALTVVIKRYILNNVHTVNFKTLIEVPILKLGVQDPARKTRHDLMHVTMQ